MFEIPGLDVLTGFDEKLGLTIIDAGTVHANGRMPFQFQGRTEIEISNRATPSYEAVCLIAGRFFIARNGRFFSYSRGAGEKIPKAH